MQDVAGPPPVGNIVEHYITSCNTQSSAPEDGQNNCPKHVELTGIINKPLLLHSVGCLYYLYQWCTVKQISDNVILIKFLPHTCNVCGRNLIKGLTSVASPRVDISSICKVGQKLEVSLPLLTRSTSAWPSRLLYRRGRKSRRDLWITLYLMRSKNHEARHHTIFSNLLLILPW